MPSKTGTVPRLRARLRGETARAILDAAEEVFSEDGLAARMERIAARAGVAVGTLYNHFEDREALLSALACSRRESFLARLDAALAETAAEPFEVQLRAFLAAVAEHGRAHGRYLSVLVQAGEGPARLKPTGAIHGEFVARADALAARGVEAGQLRPEGRELYGPALVGMARLFLVRAIEGSVPWSALTEGVADLFLRGARR